MRLFIKQRVFTWGSKFDIYDQNGAAVYYVEGEVFTFGKKLHVYDTAGREVVYIQQQLFRWRPHYDLYVNGEHAATLVHKFAFLSHNFCFEKLNWLISGDFLAHDYHVTSGNTTVMVMQKEWLTWGDTYALDINDNFNPLLAVASALAIDCACHSGGNHNH